MPDMETPEADAAEQSQPLQPADVDPEATVQPSPGDPSMEVDEGDLAESTREVALDEDDWR